MVTYFQPPTSKNSKVIDFPVVGEDIKYPDNVIDYNINSEITKDTSSVVNANNDTTTGMANVIPGINAPKLIASTSIIGGGAITYGEASATTHITGGGDGVWVDGYTIDVDGGSLYLDANYTNRLYCKKGIYLVTLDVYSNNSNANISGSLYLYNPNSTNLIAISQSGGTGNKKTYMTTAQMGDGNYLRIFATLGVTANINVKLKLVRLS